MISSPELLDVVDEEWARDTLPDDGACDRGRRRHALARRRQQLPPHARASAAPFPTAVRHARTRAAPITHSLACALAPRARATAAVPLPAGVVGPVDADEGAGGGAGGKPKEPEKWTEMGTIG
jgi:hypothetical protein